MAHASGICKVAVIGAGTMAREHLKAFADVPGVVFTGVFSRTREKAAALAAEFSLPLVADSVEGLWEGGRPDLVVVTVNAPAVAGMVDQCCRFGWTVLAEKPVGLGMAEAKAVERKAGECGARVFVALNRRFYSASRNLAKGLAADPGPRFIEVFDQQEPDRLRHLGKAPEELDNFMFANGIHLVDYLSWLGRGGVKSVTPFFPSRPESEFVVGAAVEFAGGDLGLYRAVWNAPGPWAVTVTTRSARWELRPLESLRRQAAGSRVQETVESDAVDAQFKPGLRRQAEEAVKAARGEASELVPLSEANRSMDLVSRIYGRK